MRKLLLLFMLVATAIGALGQEKDLINAGPDGVAPSASFKLDANASSTSTMQVGDLLRIYYRSNAGGYTYCDFGYDNGEYNYMFEINTNKGDAAPTTWTHKDFELTQTWIDNIKNYGLITNGWSNADNITLQKLTLVHYEDATGVSLNKSSISLGIGSSYNLLKATVEPSNANQTVEWSVVSGNEYVDIDQTTGVITGKAAGTATVRATVPGTDLYNECVVTVKQGYTLTLGADKTTVLNTKGGKINLTHTATLPGHSPVYGTDYSISYDIKENADPTHVYMYSGTELQIDAGATVGTYTIVGTLIPEGDTYAGAVATIDIIIDAPVENAIHLNIGDQTFGKSEGSKEVDGGLAIDNSIFDNDATFTFEVESSTNEEVVSASWTSSSINQHNNKVTFTIVGVGEADVTLRVDATKAGKFATTTKTIHVTVKGDPLNFTMNNLTVNDDQPLTLDAIKAAITKVYTEVNSTQTDVSPSDYEVEVYKDAVKVETSIPAQGSGVSSFVINVKVNATNPDYADATPKDITVTVTHLKSFVVDPILNKTTIKANGHETATIAPTSKYNSEDVSVTYTYESSDPTVATVSPEGVITAQKAGTVTISVKAVPDDDENYATMYATSAEITVTQSYVTITKQTIDGKEFVVVDVPEGGAFGDLSDNPTVSASSIANAVAELKAAENVKVTGNIANSDVRELVNLIGGRWTDMSDLHCETLDMGEARMTEAITYEASTYVCSLLPHFTDGDNTKSLVTVENLTLPLPCPTATVLPKGMKMLTSDFNTYSSNSLQSLVIPEGWTEVADEAWADAQSDPALGGDKCGLEHLTSLKLADSIKRIGAFAFSNSHVEKLFMPKNIEYIGAGAFNWSPKLSDIYFTGSGEKLKYVDQDAFSVQTQMVNDCIESDNICNNKNMPTMDRSHYVNGGVLACILHYPHGCDAEYTDVTRTYRVVDTYGDNLYIKGNIDPNHGAYTPENWTFDFINNVNAASKNQDVKLIQDETKPALSGGFPDVTYGYSMIWPSQYQMTTGYAIANAGYLWSGEHMSNAQLDPENGIDKRGLYQFIVALDNAPTDQEEWPFKYQQDLWYTISLPFSMTPAEIRKVFGDKTQVCRFSKVIRDVTDEDAKVLRLEFRYSVMEENDGHPRKITYTDIVEKKTNGTVVTEDIEKAGILHHHAYMIKPSGTVDSDPSIKFNSVTGERVYKGYKSEPGIIQEEKLTAVLKDPETPVPGKDYYFRPNLMETTIKKNSYVLVNKNDKHQYAFYKGVKDGSVYKDGGRALANTAYVQLDHGQADFNDYFPASTGSASVKFSSHFGDFFDDEEDITKIDKIEIVCGDEEPANDKIYTISGVLVSGKSLAPGLYIKNGKKYFVK